MKASQGGHTETLALLLANKADVHAAKVVIIMISSFEFYCTFAKWRDRLVLWRLQKMVTPRHSRCF
jgi:hypothetical protein